MVLVKWTYFVLFLFTIILGGGGGMSIFCKD